MINISKVNCLCNFEGCRKEALFNYQHESKGLYCSSHKLTNMVDLHHICKCGNGSPLYNYINLLPRYCRNCKLFDMIFISYNTCKNEHCKTTGSKKYDNYCMTCFQNLFPLDSRNFGIRKKTKEILVRDFINENFEGFQHDVPLWTGNCDCSHRRRIDHRKLIGNTLVCIETDENQHSRYHSEDEKLRYDDLYMIHGGKFIFIRFNPDSYTNKIGNKLKKNINDRLSRLKEEIEKQIMRAEQDENQELLEIIYLFYDGF